MIYKDLRGFIKQVETLGALRRIDGADPRFEIGGITEVAAGTAECPALLFDRIKGFAKGFRVFTNATTTPQRAALALGLDPALKPLDALKAWMKKRQTLTPRKPVAVTSAAFLENTMRGRHAGVPGACPLMRSNSRAGHSGVPAATSVMPPSSNFGSAPCTRRSAPSSSTCLMKPRKSL